MDEVVHFITGEPIAKVSQANGGLVAARYAQGEERPRGAAAISTGDELIERIKKAADLYLNATLPMGDGTQSPDDFARQQSASTGLPEHMCQGEHGEESFRAHAHGSDARCADARPALEILSRGYGVESRGVVVSYQASRRCWAWCCRRIRPACIRCGCR